MKSSKLGLLPIMGLAIIGFQNCTPNSLQFKEDVLSQSSLASSDTGTNNIAADGDDDDMTSPSSPQPLPPLAPMDVDCQSIITGREAIYYESLPHSTAPLRSFNLTMANQYIDYENIGIISLGTNNNLQVRARYIDAMTSFSSTNISVNVQKIRLIKGIRSSRMDIVASRIEGMSSTATQMCVSAREIGYMTDLSGDITIIGRKDGRSRIYELHNFSASIGVFDTDMGIVHHGAGEMRLVNSIIADLNNASGKIYLVNSRIGAVSNFSGEIHLYGSSAVSGINYTKTEGTTRIIKH